MTKSELESAVAARLEEVNAALGTLDDETAVTVYTLYPAWAPYTHYTRGERLRYRTALYRVEQEHDSQPNWTPPVVSALYTEIVPPGTIPVWRQPTGAQDAYHIGDKVRWPDGSGPVFVSLLDNNVWEPDVYGWEQVE